VTYPLDVSLLTIWRTWPDRIFFEFGFSSA
jgi:hypothetical protein